MLIKIAFGIPLYVCATASIPIAVSLIMKGISPGAAFVFLVVGPATNAATITLIGNALGRKMVTIYLTVISVFAIGFGYLLNWIFALLGDRADLSTMMHQQEKPLYIYILTGIFSLLMIMSLYRKFKSKQKEPEMEIDIMSEMMKFQVEGMTCNHCVANVKNAIESLNNIEKVEISLFNKTVHVEGDVEKNVIKNAIENAGYNVV